MTSLCGSKRLIIFFQRTIPLYSELGGTLFRYTLAHCPTKQCLPLFVNKQHTHLANWFVCLPFNCSLAFPIEGGERELDSDDRCLGHGTLRTVGRPSVPPSDFLRDETAPCVFFSVLQPNEFWRNAYHERYIRRKVTDTSIFPYAAGDIRISNVVLRWLFQSDGTVAEESFVEESLSVKSRCTTVLEK